MTLKIDVGTIYEFPQETDGRKMYAVVVNVFNMVQKYVQLAIGCGIPDQFDQKWIEFLLYAFPDPINDGRWKHIGNIDVNVNTDEWSMRVSAGNVYRGNEFLRPETDDDRHIPTMTIGNYGFERLAENTPNICKALRRSVINKNKLLKTTQQNVSKNTEPH